MKYSRSPYILSIFSSKFSYAKTAASPSPAIAGTFSVPERIPFCCPPPNRIGLSFVLSLIYKKPLPFGPWILCPLAESRSIPDFFGFKRIFPYACMASAWIKACLQRFRICLTASSIGVMEPISLFTSIMETRIVSSSNASSNASWQRIPWLSTGRYVTRKPCSSK